MTFVEVVEGHWIVAEEVISVKRITSKKCSVWLRGQGAEQGFVVDMKAEEFLELICSACAEEPEVDEEDE
jgi:hypothetical protein